MTASEHYRRKAHLLRSPNRWPVQARRAFLLTLPVAGVLWLLLLLGYGFLAELAGVADLLGGFWNERDAAPARTVYDLGPFRRPSEAAESARGEHAPQFA